MSCALWVSQDGRTALIAAAGSKSVEAMRLLLDRGANVKAKDLVSRPACSVPHPWTERHPGCASRRALGVPITRTPAAGRAQSGCVGPRFLLRAVVLLCFGWLAAGRQRRGESLRDRSKQGFGPRR